MYTDFYKLSARPFQLTPDPRFYFDSRTHKKAMAYLTYGLAQGEGFIIITGDIGAGKTTLVGHLIDAVDKTRFVVGKVVTTQLDADNMLRTVANAFGIKTSDTDKAGILRRIEEYLRLKAREGRRVLLVVDEAQNLPVAALEELRMLSNFQEGERALLQTFLLGQPEFRDKLAMSPELEQLRQRVIATHHLEPMQAEELPDYVYHRLALCGWDNNPTFSDEAFELMFDYSGGVPRRLNTLCSRVLLFGALEERAEIDAGVVREVIDDLKKDDTPTTGPKHIAQATTPLSSVGPLQGMGNLPPKMDSASAAQINDLARRIDLLERYVREHDRLLKQTIEILSHWAENDAEPESRSTAPAPKRKASEG